MGLSIILNQRTSQALDQAAEAVEFPEESDVLVGAAGSPEVLAAVLVVVAPLAADGSVDLFLKSVSYQPVPFN